MSESIELTLIISVTKTRGLWTVELRRENSITLLEAFEEENLANLYAKAVARKLSSLIDAAADLLA